MGEALGDGICYVTRNALPHSNVYVRLGYSKLHGIGVFAISNIAKGTNIFGNDETKLVWVDKAKLERMALKEADRSLYYDFGIDTGEMIGCPSNFHNLTPGWYLNHPNDPALANVCPDNNLNFFAARAIAEGEELTIDYEELKRAARCFRGVPSSHAHSG
jgi:hypothetical protein